MRTLIAMALITTAAGAQIPDSSVHQSTRPSVHLTRPFRVCAGGDVTLGTNLDRAWQRMAAQRLSSLYSMSADPDSLAAQLRPFVAGADVVLLNIEGAIGEGPAQTKCGARSTNCYAFRMPGGSAAALRRVADTNVVLVGNVANNHARDAGDAGRDTTIARLGAAGILVTGADSNATPVPLPSGDTIAILGFYTDGLSPDARNVALVRRLVARAVARYPIVVVTMHLGAEGFDAQRTRNASEIFLKKIDRGNPIAFADAAFAGGATLVIGHGPHVLRAAQWRGDRLVFYSLGNLLTYGPFGLNEPMNRGAIACATIDSAQFVSSAELRPTMQLAPGVLQADSSRRALKLVDSLSRLDFPKTGASVDSSGALGRRSSLLAEPTPDKAAMKESVKRKGKTPPATRGRRVPSP